MRVEGSGLPNASMRGAREGEAEGRALQLGCGALRAAEKWERESVRTKRNAIRAFSLNIHQSLCMPA